MQRKHRIQSLQGLVRERLDDIERDCARGIPQAVILAQLGSSATSLDTFRHALLRARRRAASQKRHREHDLNAVSVPTSSQMPQANYANSSDAPSPAGVKASVEKKPVTSSGPTTRPSLKTHRDFMALVRATPDRDIF